MSAARRMSVERECEEQLLRVVRALGDGGAQLVVVAVGTGDRLREDRRVRGRPRDRAVRDQPGELATVQQPSRERVEPDRHAGVVKSLQPVHAAPPRVAWASCSSGVSGSARSRSSTATRSRMSCLIGSATSQTLTFMPAMTRSSNIQKATNSRSAGSPRTTTRSQPRAKPEYSMPTSYWSEKKYGRRSYGADWPSMLRAAAGAWLSAFAQCSTRIGSP